MAAHGTAATTLARRQRRRGRGVAEHRLVGDLRVRQQLPNHLRARPVPRGPGPSVPWSAWLHSPPQRLHRRPLPRLRRPLQGAPPAESGASRSAPGHAANLVDHAADRVERLAGRGDLGRLGPSVGVKSAGPRASSARGCGRLAIERGAARARRGGSRGARRTRQRSPPAGGSTRAAPPRCGSGTSAQLLFCAGLHLSALVVVLLSALGYQNHHSGAPIIRPEMPLVSSQRRYPLRSLALLRAPLLNRTVGS